MHLWVTPGRKALTKALDASVGGEILGLVDLAYRYLSICLLFPILPARQFLQLLDYLEESRYLL